MVRTRKKWLELGQNDLLCYTKLGHPKSKWSLKWFDWFKSHIDVKGWKPTFVIRGIGLLNKTVFLLGLTVLTYA